MKEKPTEVRKPPPDLAGGNEPRPHNRVNCLVGTEIHRATSGLEKDLPVC